MRGNLRPTRTNFNVVVKTESSKRFFEKNQGLIQFILVLVTFLTLVASVYFSNMSLQISKNQLEQAKEQLILAQNQFKESLAQRAIDKADEYKKDSSQEMRFKVQAAMDLKNLQSFDLQAKIAKSQFESQYLMNKDIVYQNRPIFSLISVKLDSVKSLVSITIKNVGKRPAKILLTKVAICNPSYKEMYTNGPVIENIDLNESIEVTFKVGCTPTYYKNPKTMYYLHFKFQDLATNQTQNYVKYFHWQFDPPNTYSWSDISLPEQLIFINRAKTAKFDLSL